MSGSYLTAGYPKESAAGILGCGEKASDVPRAEEEPEGAKLCKIIEAYVSKHSQLQVEVPTPWERYEFKKRLGSGSFGVVSRVEDRRTGEQRALKEVKRPGTLRTNDNCQAWKRLLTEIEVLSELNNPGCVKLHDLIATPTSLCMVLELVPGCNLQQYALRYPISDRDASEIAAHVLHALVYLHDVMHIVHRDIKPENILITTKSGPIDSPREIDAPMGSCPVSGQIHGDHPSLGSAGDRYIVKLVDFGSSRYIKGGLLGGKFGNCEEFNSVAATPVGSALFLALETINNALMNDEERSRNPVDPMLLPKLDLFSLGVVMYILLCRRHPFRGTVVDGPTAMRDKMMDRNGHSKLSFPDDNELEGALPDAFKNFVSSLLALNPRERPTAAEALRHPYVVCRQYRCRMPRKDRIVEDTTCGYKAPEERYGWNAECIEDVPIVMDDPNKRVMDFNSDSSSSHRAKKAAREGSL
eukprot:Sspe_Gene.95653::Locus_67941_Transcript_1_1_Confidence_1.000_Length_1647::g.95653::m.95653/K08803/DAPK; death-associated protein kinase